MPKRFTDTDKWKKPFIRGLQGAYKLLWLYILDDCDHAGIWAVDFEVARIRIGEPSLDRDQALRVFGERIEVLNNGTKWFLRDFIDFQYGPLNEKNRMHLSVINILSKNNIKGLTSPLRGAKDMDKDKYKDKEQDKDKESGFEFEFKSAFDELTLEDFQRHYKHKGLDIEEQLKSFRFKCDNDKATYYHRPAGTLRTNFQYQLDHANNSKKPKASSFDDISKKIDNAR